MNSTTAKIAAPVVGAAVLGTGLLAVAPAMAATEDVSAPVAATNTAGVQGDVTKSKPISRKQALKKKYGMYPLPISERQIKKYHVSKKQLKDIKKAEKLANTSHAKYIRQRESHSTYSINTGNGYYGAYQFDRGTWLANGGRQFGATANKAPKWAQDYVMWRTHRARGWQPWGG